MRDESEFWNKVDRQGPEDCWMWQAATYDGGYGHYWNGSDMMPAHQAAYFYEHGEKPDDIIMHLCDEPGCVNPSHLAAGDQEENMSDASNKGRMANGESHPDAELTEDDVRKIRKKYKAGGVTYSELAEEYDVHETTIGWIVRRKSWQHVD